MNNYSALRSGIYSFLTTGTNTFKTAVGGKLYYHLTPQGITAPWAVFDIITATETEDTAVKFITHLVQFTVIGISLSSVETLMTTLTDVFDDKENSLLVSGFSVIKINKDFQRPPEFGETLWSQIVQYSIELQK
jgi:Ni,Fe-hydrogenase I cytochrome b subunit